MREKVLRDFFEGSVSGEELSAELGDALRYSGGRTFLNAEPMEPEFPVHISHLIRVCDAFVAGELSPENIEAIGFCLIGSDSFEYDTDTAEGELIGETCYDWAHQK